MLDRSDHSPWPRTHDGATGIVVVSADFEWRHARALIMDYIEWARTALRIEDPYQAQPSLRSELADLAAVYTPPHGRMAMAWLDGVPMGVVGVVKHADGTGEMKRLYVRPAGRGHGLGERLTQACIAFAAGLGCHTLKLETVTGLMDRAIVLYRRLGFVETAPFGETAVEGLLFLEHRLPPETSLVA
jgi:GNAT superfamily N-acetyltransferase